MNEILNSIILIEQGEEILNVHTGSLYIVVNIEEQTVLLMNEDGEKSLIYWNELVENFEIKNKIK